MREVPILIKVIPINISTEPIKFVFPGFIYPPRKREFL